MTLQGEIFHSEGPIQAGAGESEGEQTCIRTCPAATYRSGEDQDLVEQIAALDGQLSQLVQGLQVLQADSARLEREGESARQHSQKAGRLLDQAKAAHDQAGRATGLEPGAPGEPAG